MNEYKDAIFTFYLGFSLTLLVCMYIVFTRYTPDEVIVSGKKFPIKETIYKCTQIN